jgi:hypothetical protein
MDINFADPNEIPLPPEEIRFRKINATPSPDGKQVKVHLEIDPFLKGPNVDISILDEQGDELSSVSIIEMLERKMDMVLHIHTPQSKSKYTVQTTLYYSEIRDESDQEFEFSPLIRTIVDTSNFTFMSNMVDYS